MTKRQLAEEARKQFWQEHIQSWQKSNIDQAEYCRRTWVKEAYFLVLEGKIFKGFIRCFPGAGSNQDKYPTYTKTHELIAGVFPTGVGMNRIIPLSSNESKSVPHRRGDEPISLINDHNNENP